MSVSPLPSNWARNQAIVNCNLCDLNGYRAGSSTICDHVDHRPAYDRGMAAVRAVLDKSRKESIRPTLMARQEAFNIQQLVERQRTGNPSTMLPEVSDE